MSPGYRASKTGNRSARNTGVAFGMLDAFGPAFSRWGLSLLALGAIGLVAWLFRGAPEDSTRLLVSLSLVLGGAAGNLLDRIFQGSVTDFLGVYIGSYRWPDFNVADSAISIGLVLLMIDTLMDSSGRRVGLRSPS